MIFLLLVIFRTIRIHYNSTSLNSNAGIVYKYLISFTFNEIKIIFYCYIALVSIYVLSERIFKYNIFPSNIYEVHKTIAYVMSLNPNYVIYQLFLAIFSMYVAFILPLKIIRYYNCIIKNINSPDYLYLFSVKVIKRIINLIKNDD